MIYLDTSIALAHLLVEDASPPEKLWQEALISSRLLEYEIWTRIYGRKLERSHADEVHALLGRVAWVELAPPVLTRALEPFPRPVRTLDALHLASIDFLRRQGQSSRLRVTISACSALPAPCGCPFTRFEITPALVNRITLFLRAVRSDRFVI